MKGLLERKYNMALDLVSKAETRNYSEAIVWRYLSELSRALFSLGCYYENLTPAQVDGLLELFGEPTERELEQMERDIQDGQDTERVNREVAQFGPGGEL